MTRLLLAVAMCAAVAPGVAQSATVRTPVNAARAVAAKESARIAALGDTAAARRATANDTTAAKRADAGRDLDAPSNIMTITREVFTYGGTGRRDPFYSLLLTSDLRPTINDLVVSLIAYDATGKNSVAFLTDLHAKEEYRARVGDRLGRLRVVSINPKSIVFDIDEFGFQRRETLMLNDSTKVRR